jgi:hypothetical protein
VVDVVARYRAATAQRPCDEGYTVVVEELRRTSPEFAALWKRADVRAGSVPPKRLEHPAMGELHLEATQLRLPARPDLTIVLHNALGAETTAKRNARPRPRATGLAVPGGGLRAAGSAVT